METAGAGRDTSVARFQALLDVAESMTTCRGPESYVNVGPS